MSKDERDLNDSEIFSSELMAVLKQKEDEKHWDVKRYVDGEPKNVNPLTEIPESEMRLYGIFGTFKSVFFDTEEELIEYVKVHSTQLGMVCVIDYLGNVAGCSDVIRLTYKSGRQVLYTSVNEDGYAKYNNERSIYRGEFVWEYHYGSIRELYSAFRDRGIVFEDDTYAKIDEYYGKIMAMCEERHIFTGSSRTKQVDEKQNFDVLTVPCDGAFVVAPEKAEEFKKQKLNPEARQRAKEMAEKFRMNNLTTEVPVLKKTKKPRKK